MTIAVALAVGAPHQKWTESSGGRVIKVRLPTRKGPKTSPTSKGATVALPRPSTGAHAVSSLSGGVADRRAGAAGAARLHLRRLCPPNPALPRAESCRRPAGTRASTYAREMSADSSVNRSENLGSGDEYGRANPLPTYALTVTRYTSCSDGPRLP